MLGVVATDIVLLSRSDAAIAFPPSPVVADSESAFSWLRGRARTFVEHLDEVVNTAFKRFGEPQHHREAWHFHAALEVAAEGAIRSAALGELSLHELASDAKLAQELAEDHAF